jgi:hypothetical protein
MIRTFWPLIPPAGGPQPAVNGAQLTPPTPSLKVASRFSHLRGARLLLKVTEPLTARTPRPEAPGSREANSDTCAVSLMFMVVVVAPAASSVLSERADAVLEIPCVASRPASARIHGPKALATRMRSRLIRLVCSSVPAVPPAG